MIPKMIPNPAWAESEEAKIQKQLTMDDCAHRGECPEDVFPEEYGKDIPEAGAWIMLLTSVRVGKQTDSKKTKPITLPHLSMWYAMPTVSTARVAMHPMRKRRTEDREWAYLHQAVVNTPDGSVHIWPHEYNKIDITKFLDLCDDDGLFIHYLSDKAQVDEYALFYLRSRGISKAEAQRMLLGTMTDPNFCYFTVSPEIAGYFGEGCGMSYLNSVNHERRAAAHKKKEEVTV